MPMREPTRSEAQILDALGQIPGVAVAYFELTQTQLDKSIVDAHQQIRASFRATNFHDYERQPQGREHAAERSVQVLTPSGLVASKMILRRPSSGNGDPRLWVSNLRKILSEATPGDLIALVQDGSRCVVVDVSEAQRSSRGPSSAEEFFAEASASGDPDSADEPEGLIDRASNGRPEAPTAGANAEMNLLARAAAWLAHQEDGTLKVLLEPGISRDFGPAFVHACNELAGSRPGGWNEEYDWCYLVVEPPATGGAISVDDAGAYREGNRLLCISSGLRNRHTLDPYDHLGKEGFPGDEGLFSFDRLGEAVLEVCVSEGRRRQGVVGKSMVGHPAGNLLAEALRFIKSLHEAGKQQAHWTPVWFEHVELGLHALVAAIEEAEPGKDLNELLESCAFACFSIPTPNNRTKFTGPHHGVRAIDPAVRSHWKDERTFVETVRSLVVGEAGHGRNHSLGEINAVGLDGLIQQHDFSPMLGIAHLDRERQGRWKCFQGLTESQFFDPGGESSASIQYADGRPHEIPQLPEGLYLIDGVDFDPSKRQLRSPELRIVTELAPGNHSDDEEGTNLEVTVDSDSLRFEGTVRRERDTLVAIGRLLVDVGPGRFGHSATKTKLRIEVPPGDPLAEYAPSQITTEFCLLPHLGRVALVLEENRDGVILDVQPFGTSRFEADGKPEEDQETTATCEVSSRLKRRTVVLWSTADTPVARVDVVDLDQAEGLPRFFSGQVVVTTPRVAAIDDFELTLRQPDKQTTAPKSPLMAAILDTQIDDEPPEGRSLRHSLENAFSAMVREGTWEDCLGHVLLPSDRDEEVAFLRPTPDRKFLTLEGMATDWEQWLARPSVPDDFAASEEAREFRRAFEQLGVRGRVPEGKWVSQATWAHLASEDPNHLEGYLNAYSRLIQAAERREGDKNVCRLWAAYPFSATVWKTTGDQNSPSELLAVLLGPLHPLRLAWFAHAEAVLSEAEETRSLSGAIEGWNLPFLGPSETGPGQMVAIQCDGGPSQVFLSWSMLLKCRQNAFGTLQTRIRAGNQDLPGASTGGLNGAAVGKALEDFRDLYPQVSTLTIDLAANAPVARLSEVDRKVLDVVHKWEGSEQALRGGIRVFDSLYRSGPVPTEHIRAKASDNPELQMAWSRYTSENRPPSDLRFLEDPGLSLGTWVRSGHPRGALSRRPIRRGYVPDSSARPEDPSSKVDPILLHGEGPYGTALCLIEGAEDRPQLRVKLDQLNPAGGDSDSKWTVTGESLLPPATLANLLNLGLPGQSQTLWEWSPPFLNQSDLGEATETLGRRPYISIVQIPKRFITAVAHLLTEITGDDQGPDEARKTLEVLGTRGIGLSRHLRYGGTVAPPVGAVGFATTFRLLDQVTSPDADYLVMPLDASRFFLAALAGVDTAAGRRADLLVLRLSEESLTLVPVEIKLYGTEESRVVREAHNQLEVSRELLKKIQNRSEDLRARHREADLSLFSNAVAQFVEAAMRISPKGYADPAATTARLERLANGDMPLRVGVPLLAYFTRDGDAGRFEADKLLGDDLPSGFGARGFFANIGEVMRALDAAESSTEGEATGGLIEAWQQMVVRRSQVGEDEAIEEEVVEEVVEEEVGEDEAIEEEVGEDEAVEEEVVEDEAVEEEVVEEVVGDGVKFPVGTLQGVVGRAQAYFWPSNTDLMHLNMGIVGDLGTGKTQLLKMLVAQLKRQADAKQPNPISVLILDYKGDFLGVRDDFLNAVGGRLLEPRGIPLTPIGLQDVNDRQERAKKKADFIDVLTKIDSGVGAVQVHHIRETLDDVWDNVGPSPTMEQVAQRYFANVNQEPDTVYSLLETFTDAEVFSTDPNEFITFEELMHESLVVLNLHAIGRDDRLKNSLVALFLNHYYEYMLNLRRWDFQGDDPELRRLNSFLVIDEAKNIMPKKFRALGTILREGRDFGVGVVLASQYLNDFKTTGANAENYAEPLRTWFIHNVPNVTQRQLSDRGLPDATNEDADEIKRLAKHHSYYKSLDYEGKIIRNIPFFELLEESADG